MAEKEYIEYESLIKELVTLLSDLHFIVKYERQHGSVSDVEKSKAKLETTKGFISLVKSQPTADVQEVRHGEWLPTNHPEQKRCSVCDVISFIALYPCINKADYCPNCGAKMDEE